MYLKEIFKRWEWFEENEDDIEVKVLEAADLEFDTHNKVHYKHFERWRLANTLVKLYGQQKGYNYLRKICSNSIKDKELQADCTTAARHQKPVDVWAVNRLNNIHGFKIKLDVQDTSFDESEIFKSMDKITNPCLNTAFPLIPQGFWHSWGSLWSGEMWREAPEAPYPLWRQSLSPGRWRRGRIRSGE